MQDDLQRRRLMYGELNLDYGGTNKTWFSYSLYPDMTNDGVYRSNASFSKDMVFLSTNDTTDENFNTITPWDVLAAVQLTSVEFEPKLMNSFHCRLRAPTARWILTWTDASSMLYSWRAFIGHAMYMQSRSKGSRLVPDPAASLEANLNIMTMSLGVLQGENGTRGDGDDLAPWIPLDELDKGCLVSKTLVPWPIVALFIVVALLLLWAVVYHAALEWRLRRLAAERRRDAGLTGRDAVPYVPVGFMSWLKHAAATQKDGSDVKTRRLKNWHFTVNNRGVATLDEKAPSLSQPLNLNLPTASSVPSTPMSAGFSQPPRLTTTISTEEIDLRPAWPYERKAGFDGFTRL